MMDKKEIIREMIQECIKIVNAYSKFDSKPRDYGTGELLYLSELHMIQAIGSKRAETVTELSSNFSITKGGVSQIISRLEKKGYILKLRKPEYGKEVMLILTEKGIKAYDLHEQAHGRAIDKLVDQMSTLSDEKLDGVNDFFNVISEFLKEKDS
jgi:DNA-binding MarR family transcriptional regulator